MGKKAEGDYRQMSLEMKPVELKPEKEFTIYYYHPKTKVGECQYGHGFFRNVIPNAPRIVKGGSLQDVLNNAPTILCSELNLNGCGAALIKSKYGLKVKS